MISPYQKLFPADKNYILKHVQADLRESLISKVVYRVINNYLFNYNPMGLKDPAIEQIENYIHNPRRDGYALYEFYLELAVIYRYRNHDNQLEIMFEGADHYDMFATEWEKQLLEWTDEFCQHPHFVKAVIGGTVFYSNRHSADLVSGRLKTFLNKQFGLKVYKYRGVQAYKAAS